MTKIDIFSGFLGAGKTTLIQKLLKEALVGEKVVLIENEFGEIGIDGGFMKEAGIEVTEMNSGCICCSLVGDFGDALRKVIDQYHPDRILIEPSGVGKLSDVIRAVEQVAGSVPEVQMGSFVTAADAGKCKMYIKNFGEFFLNQIEYAGTILLSRTKGMSPEKLEPVVELLRKHNDKARILTTPWDELSGETILSAMTEDHSLAEQMLSQVVAEARHAHAHEHHEHDAHCDHEHDAHCDHDHEHDAHCCHDHDHEHHEHDAHCCHEHEHDGHCDHDHEHDAHCDHDHEHDAHCCCGHYGHHGHHGHGHHGHDADEVFESWGVTTVRAFTEEGLHHMLCQLEDEAYGIVLRAKGIVPGEDGRWIHFDYTPGEPNVRRGGADYTGRLCVIGAKLNEPRLAELFGIR